MLILLFFILILKNKGNQCKKERLRSIYKLIQTTTYFCFIKRIQIMYEKKYIIYNFIIPALMDVELAVLSFGNKKLNEFRA